MLPVYQLPHGGHKLIKVDKPVSEMDDCSICISQFLGKSVVETNCNHLFHTSCLKTWINTKVDGVIIDECPLCRRNISVLRAPLNQIELYDANKELAIKELAMLCLTKSKQKLEKYFSGEKDIRLEDIRINLQIASDNGLEAKAKPLLILCRLEMAKQALENYLNGNKKILIDFISANLQFAYDNGLKAEAKPLLIHCRLEMAKQALENYLNGNKKIDLYSIRSNLEIASDNGLEAEAKPLLIHCRLEMAKQALENYLNGNKKIELDFIRSNLEIASDNGLKAEAKPFFDILNTVFS